MAENPDDICDLCTQTRAWHEENKPRHAFVLKGEAGAGKLNEKPKDQPASAVVRRGLGGDPALRLALINKGVLNLEDLMVAEEALDAARASGTPAVADAASRSGTALDGGSTPPYPRPGD